MKVAIVFKWTRDPRDARISVEGELVWGNAKLAASDDDPAAMEVARCLSPEGDIVAVTADGGDNAWAAARGAASTVIVEGVEDTLDASRTAAAIAQAVRSIGVDAVVVGDSDWNGGVPVALMAELGMPAYAGVTEVAPADGATVLVTCKEGPVYKVVQAKPPMLLSVRGLTSEKAAPGMKQVLAARKKPQERMGAADAPCAAAPLRAGAVSLPEAGLATMIDGANVDFAARELVSALRRDGVL